MGLIWFVPTHRGDIRLVPLDASGQGTLLEIEKPSPGETRILEAFLALCHKRDWLTDIATPTGVGITKIALPQSVAEVSPLLVEAAYGTAEVWTALRLPEGIELKVGVPVPEKVPETTQAAVTVRQPERGCPAPEPCNERASEVLRTFCSQTQWRSWQAAQSLVAYGGSSGKPYRIYHRNQAARKGLGHILVDADNREVCVWDATVPAEEEVLATKLAVEHREDWLRGPFPAHFTALERLPGPRLHQMKSRRPPR
jgi:hypothetical protein